MSGKPVRLALLAPSPVHVHTPLYQRLAADPRLDFTAIFASSGGVRPHDSGYGQPISWDIDLLQGYKSTFLRKADTNSIGDDYLDLFDPDIVPHLFRSRYEVLLVFGYNQPTLIIGMIAQRLLGRLLLFREEQTILHSRPLWKRAIKRITLPLLFAQGRALYIGRENRRWFQHYGVPSRRLFFTPYCVDNERLQAQAEVLAPQKQQIRREFGIDDDAGPVILTVGRLMPKKQPLALLEAFKRARAQRRCALLVVGSGELQSRMEEKVKGERIPDVVFAGFLNQSQVPRAYACADMFALVSRLHETWGLVVNEAMNFGLPVVVSNKVGSSTDLVQDGVNGLVVDRDDIDGMARALLELVQDECKRRTFGAAGREIISNWNYDVCARGVISATATAVGAKRWGEV
jgi:glycosyltransferase involved in cell wall biosynthesis